MPVLLLLHIHFAELVKTTEVAAFKPTFHSRMACEDSLISIDMRIDIIKAGNLLREVARLVDADFKDAFHRFNFFQRELLINRSLSLT